MSDKLCTINTSELIQSARSVSQYKINVGGGQKRLITIIGELHEMEFECDGNSISIYNYCLNRAKQNDKCHFMFEYGPNVVDKSRIGSKIIQDVFTSGPNKVMDRSVGIDIRLDYLTRKTQTLLYNDDVGFYSTYSNDPTKIAKDFIDTYNNDKFKYKCNELNLYSKKVKDEFKYSKERLKSYESDVYNNIDLKWAWAMVMDGEIMTNILKPDKNINEYVIVVGENHCKNIHNVIDTWSKDRVEIVSHLKHEYKKCINTKKLKKLC
jgi:hypothetical protein